MPVLAVNDLRVCFESSVDQRTAVDGVSFSLQRGQTLGIVGESGSGKSVTSLSLMGLIAPQHIQGGEVWFQDSPEAEPVNLLALPPRDIQAYRGRQLSMIFQEPMSSLNPVYSIGFQLLETLRRHQALSKSAAQQRAIALLQEVKLIPTNAELVQQIFGEDAPELSDTQLQAVIAERPLLQERQLAFLKRYPHELSGGQIQRVMIAIALASDPAVLIADEPTTALDVTVQAQILALLRELRDQRGMAIIFVTHDLGIIAEIADQVAVMYQGKIVETGTAADIFHRPQHPYTQGLLACRPQPDQNLAYLPTIADFLEQADTPPPPPRQPAVQRLEVLTQQPPLVQVRGLQVRFPVRGPLGQVKYQVAAVNNVSFEIYPGETLGLVGESGCGKTTLGRTLVRLLQPTSGDIYFDSQPITQLRGKALRHLRQNLQIIFQDPFSSLNPRMTVGAAITEPLRIYKRLSGAALQQRASELVERVGLQPRDLRRYPHEFSGGQRQRICIARALALNPQFIVCDESVSALDVSVQAQVLNLLKELQQELALTYLFISHDLGVVQFMSDRIMVMNQGEIAEIGPADQIYHHPQQPYTRQLIEAIPLGIPPSAA